MNLLRHEKVNSREFSQAGKGDVNLLRHEKVNSREFSQAGKGEFWKNKMKKTIQLILSGIFVLYPLQNVFANPNVLSKIAEMHASGEIDFETSLLYQLYFLRAPEMLPAQLRSLPPPEGLRCGTFITKQIMDFFPSLSRKTKKLMEPLLSPPSSVGYVESTRFPIRVNYRTEELRSSAEQMLPFFEYAWEVEVQRLGWLEPITNFSRREITTGINAFVGPTGMDTGGYTSMYSWNYSTPWMDCSTYIVIDENNYPDAYPFVIAHEFNHSCQGATDCLETMCFWEATAVFTEGVVYSYDPIPGHFIHFFQKFPYYSIDYDYVSMDVYDERFYYKYGASIFNFFLDEYYGDNDGKFVVNVWKNSMQNGWQNEPDFMDAIPQTIGEYGSTDTFDDAYFLFSEWRYFTGANDDGNHFRHGGEWWNTEVELDGFYSLRNLPVEAASPQNPPAEYGANYIRVQTHGAEADDILRFEIDGDEGVEWAGEIIRISTANVPSYQKLSFDEDRKAAANVTEISNYYTVVLVVINLGDGDHDADNGDWATSSYKYSIALFREPKIYGLQPDKGYQGAKNYEVTVTGDNFLSSEQYEVSFPGGGITVKSAEVILENKIQIRIDIDTDAVLGMRDIEITTPTQQSIKKLEAFEVYALPFPLITKILPEWAEPGVEELDFWIYGENFFDGDGLTAFFSGEGIDFNAVSFVDEQTIYSTISIARDAAKGKRDLTLKNPDEKSHTAKGIFSVGKPSEGCLCASGGGGFSVLVFFFIFFVFGGQTSKIRICRCKKSLDKPFKAI